VHAEKLADNSEEPHARRSRWVKDCPRAAGVPLEQRDTRFREWKRHLNEGGSRWAPFASQGEWEIAEWMMRRLGQEERNEMLALSMVRVLTRGSCIVQSCETHNR
jgi:hypothetical protein